MIARVDEGEENDVGEGGDDDDDDDDEDAEAEDTRAPGGSGGGRRRSLVTNGRLEAVTGTKSFAGERGRCACARAASSMPIWRRVYGLWRTARSGPSLRPK